MTKIIKEDYLESLDRIINLITSPGWKDYLSVTQCHKQFLQEEVNTRLRSGEYRLADRAQAKLEDINKLLELFQKKLNELKDAKKKGKQK